MLKSKRDGFSLIEVMVALVILVIGLIGIFNLHIVAKRSSFESFQQTQAAYLANDMLNRMKSNRTELANYAGTYGALAAGETVPTSCDQSGANCNSSNMRVWDLYQWRWTFSGGAEVDNGKNVGGLDTTTACIVVNDRNVNIVIAWRGIREMAGKVSSSSNCGSALNNRRRLFELVSVIERN